MSYKETLAAKGGRCEGESPSIHRFPSGHGEGESSSTHRFPMYCGGESPPRGREGGCQVPLRGSSQ